ncbi:hypothetical protein TRFO_05850 [Tritrichomonas foetus]|uniref:USP domain-containing protein n=1 Tax=Tritrichomonas foetus TaxID=1144522 RepID=A0A1J4K3E3_9EUKA|nr:hypothetical protein TRFO_05850 [Tritrichomonas foetus]|eukprot:OHT05699.1 hypothetical protein TRFO_05850 [Tritrichomonas foetus]
MNEINDFSAWSFLVNDEPGDVTSYSEIAPKFKELILSLSKKGFLYDSIENFTDEFLQILTPKIVAKILNVGIVKDEELKIVQTFLKLFFDIGIYGILSHDINAINVLSNIVLNDKKELFESNSRKQLYQNTMKKYVTRGIMHALYISIKSIQNIELLCAILKLVAEISQFDPFFQAQNFFDISIEAIKRSICNNQDVISIKSLISCFDSIQQFIPFSDEAHVYFMKIIMPILVIFISSDNLEQRFSSLSQFLKYAKEPIFLPVIVNFFSIKENFQLFFTISLHPSISKITGKLISLIISKSETIGKVGIISDIWNMYQINNNQQQNIDQNLSIQDISDENIPDQINSERNNDSNETSIVNFTNKSNQNNKIIKNDLSEGSTFYDTFLYIGKYLNGELFDEFVNCILSVSHPTAHWFEIVNKLAGFLSKKNQPIEIFKNIRDKIWYFFYIDPNPLTKNYARESLIHMIGFNADESDLFFIEKIQSEDIEFFYRLLRQFLINNVKLSEETISNLLDQLIGSIDYFPDFFELITSLFDKHVINTHAIFYISQNIPLMYINTDFYRLIKHVTCTCNGLTKCITKLPLKYEELLWKYAVLDTPIRFRFAKLLSRIYLMNDGKVLTDSCMINIFLKQWMKYLTEAENELSDDYNTSNNSSCQKSDSIDKFLKLLSVFIDTYESNMYRDPDLFINPLSYERSFSYFTVTVECEKPEFVVKLLYPIHMTIETIVEELHRKQKVNLNNANIYYNGIALKRSAPIKEVAEDDKEITLEIKKENAVIPHQYHLRTEIPSRLLIKQNWFAPKFEEFLEQERRCAYEVIKLLPSNSKKLDLTKPFSDNFEYSKPFIFAYHFYILYFMVFNDLKLLRKVVNDGIFEYMFDFFDIGISLLSDNSENDQYLENNTYILHEIGDIFNHFTVLTIKNGVFPDKLKVHLISLLLVMASKGFNINPLTISFKYLFQNDARLFEMPKPFNHIELLLHENPQVRKFACQVFINIDIDFNEYLNILKDGEINDIFLHSLSTHFTGQLDQKYVEELSDILMNMLANSHSVLLKALLGLLYKILSCGFLTSTQREQCLEFIISKFITLNLQEDDRIAFKAASKCLGILSNMTPTLHPVLEKLHMNRKPFDQFNINGDDSMISKLGRVGLKRIGNTCYLNSILQMLFAIIPLRNHIMTYDSDDDPFMNELSKLFVFMKHLKTKSITTQYLFNQFYYEGEKVDASIQQDVAEFLQDFINNKKLIGDLKLFEGTLTHINEGIYLEFRKETTEMFSLFDLEVKGYSNLQKSFEHFSKPEGESHYFDDKIGKKIDVKRYSKISEAPPILILHLKRFDYNKKRRETNETIKIDDEFEIPLDLDITPYSTLEVPFYHLTGIIIHRGTALSGHYLCISLTKNGWIMIDDENVTSMKEQEVLSLAKGGSFKGNAYILFYTRDDYFNLDDSSSISLNIRTEFLEEAAQINANNDEQRLFCSLGYFNVISTLEKSTSIDYHDIALKYAIDSLPFIRLKDQSSVVQFYHNIMKKIKLMTIEEKIHILEYSLDFLKSDLLLCPNELIRSQTAKLLGHCFDQRADPQAFLRAMLPIIRDCLSYPTQLDQFFEVSSIIINIYHPKQNDSSINQLNSSNSPIYSNVRSCFIDFMSGEFMSLINNSQLNDMNLSHFLDLTIYLDAADVIKSIDFLNKVIVSKTNIDSIVAFTRYTFKDDENAIFDYLKNNISSIPLEKFIPFHFLLNPGNTIKTIFEQKRTLKTGNHRHATVTDIASVLCYTIKQFPQLSRIYIRSMDIWVNKLLFDQNENVREIALGIFSYILPIDGFQKWNNPKYPSDLKFASLSLELNGGSKYKERQLQKYCKRVLNFLLDSESKLSEILKNMNQKTGNDDICQQYFDIIEQLLLSSLSKPEKVENLANLFENLAKYQLNPFSKSLIRAIQIINEFSINVSVNQLESSIKNISNVKHSDSHRMFDFMQNFIHLHQKYSPSDRFLNDFLQYCVFSPDIKSEHKFIFKYVKNLTKEWKFEIIAIVDKNLKVFARLNYSSLLVILDILHIKRPILSFMKESLEKPQFLPINQLVKMAFDLNNSDIFDTKLISILLKNYDLDTETKARLEELHVSEYSSSESSDEPIVIKMPPKVEQHSIEKRAQPKKHDLTSILEKSLQIDKNSSCSSDMD